MNSKMVIDNWLGGLNPYSFFEIILFMTMRMFFAT